MISLPVAGQRFAQSIASSRDFTLIGEGTVGHDRLAAGERHPRAHRRRVQAVERDQHAGVFQGLIVFHHRRHALGIELNVGRRGLVA